MGNGCGVYEGRVPKDVIPIRCGTIYYKKEPIYKLAKVLFLGAAESGKSTICRHIRRLHGERFNDDEMSAFKHHIRTSCLVHFMNIIQDLMKDQTYATLCPNECVKFYEECKVLEKFDRAFMDKAVTIWRISVVQKYMLSLMNPFGIPMVTKMKRLHSDNPANHFLPSFSRIMARGYGPTWEDILSVRIPTMGIMETFLKRETLSISLIDVGGQRSERRKWLHCFDSVNAVIFVVALSEYDQVLVEDTTVNRMHESLKLFNTVCTIKWFLESDFVLFLNKKDVFDEKISYSPLTQCFPGYEGEDDKFHALNYVWEKFSKENNTKRQIYIHCTCGKDTKNINIVFDILVDTIILANMKEASFL